MKKRFLVVSTVMLLMSLVSVLQAGTVEYIAEVNGHAATISNDGRYIAYQDFAEFEYIPGVRVQGKGNRTFIRDRQTGETREIYGGVINTITLLEIIFPRITGDGNHLVFFSRLLGTDPVERTGMCGLFVRNLLNDETVVASLGADACRIGLPVAVSDDGRYVSYYGFHQSYPYVDGSIFFQDLQMGTMERLDPPLKNNADYGYAGDYFGNIVTMSKDGRYVAFNYIMVSNQQKGTKVDSSIYLRDTVTGGIKKESGTDLTNYGPIISADGNYYLYNSLSKGFWEIGDTQTGKKETLTLATDTFPYMSGDGRYLAYDFSGGINLYDRMTNITETVVVDGRSPLISANGRFILFRGNDAGPLGSIVEKLYLYDRGF